MLPLPKPRYLRGDDGERLVEYSVALPVAWKRVDQNQRLSHQARAERTRWLRNLMKLETQSRMHELLIPKATALRWMMLTLHRGKGEQTLDYEQVVASLKPAVDGIADTGLIYRDSMEFLDRAYQQRKHSEPWARIDVVVRWRENNDRVN